MWLPGGQGTTTGSRQIYIRGRLEPDAASVPPSETAHGSASAIRDLGLVSG